MTEAKKNSPTERGEQAGFKRETEEKPVPPRSTGNVYEVKLPFESLDWDEKQA